MGNYASAKKSKGLSISDITNRATTRAGDEKESSSHRIIVESPDAFYQKGNIRDVTESMIEERRVSMQNDRQLTPIVVHPKDESGKYLIHDGLTRWLAAQRIPGCQLRAEVNPDLPFLGDVDAIVSRVNANDVHNKNDLLSLAKVYSDLGEMGLSQSDIAVRFHKTKDQVSKILKLLQLPEENVLALTNARLIRPGSYRLVYELVKLYEISQPHFSNVVRVALEQGVLTQETVILQRKKLEAPGSETSAGHSAKPHSVEAELGEQVVSPDGVTADKTESGSTGWTGDKSGIESEQVPSGAARKIVTKPIFMVVDAQGVKGRLITDRVSESGKILALIDGEEVEYEPQELSLTEAR
jgi:ParB/RepB/Spo0J family partition protein